MCSNPAKSKEGDMFAFGTLIYQFGTGRLPFETLEQEEILLRMTSGELASISITENVNTNLAVIIR